MNTKGTRTQAITVVGLGYVGLPLALLADRKGYRVIGIDTNTERVRSINERNSPFLNAEVAYALPQSRIEATDDFSRSAKSSITVICVPTPVSKCHLPDLSMVEDACRNIGAFLKAGDLVILESTVNPGVCETIVLPLLEQKSGLTGGVDFHLAHCPERVSPGDTKWNVENINRVIGSSSSEGLRLATSFYASLITGTIMPMKSLREAEAVKIVENSFRDVNIAFVNELAMSFSRVGIDIVNVIEGAATKPFAFMPHFPGCGVGGHCVPVDPYYMIAYGKENGFEHRFLSLAREINTNMPAFMIKQIVNDLHELGFSLKDTTVAVLGLAYKADVDDCRESPSFEIIRLLKEQGATVASYDPYLPDRSTHNSIEAVLEGATVAVVATGHKVFTKLSPELFVRSGVQLVVDGRNCLSKNILQEAGLIYRGVGT